MVTARCKIAFDQEEQNTLGRTVTYRQNGELCVTIFDRIELGDAAILTLADTVIAEFRDVDIGPARFHSPWLTPSVRVGNQWSREVHCPFHCDRSFTLPDQVAGSNSGVLGFHNTIRDRFDTLVAQPQAVPVQYDDAPLTPPSGSPWIRFSIIPGSSEIVDIAAVRLYRSLGVAIAQIFVPIDRGSALGLQLADAIVATFRSVTDRGVAFGEPKVEQIGRAGSVWQINVTIPFEATNTA